MFEKIMKKIGYCKITKDQELLLELVKTASKNDDNIYIDYVKSKKKSTVYVKSPRLKKTIFKTDLCLKGEF